MSQVFVIGAAGKIGRLLVRRLAERGHVPLALHRKEAQGPELEALGARPVRGDLVEIGEDALASEMAGSDAVIFTAGAGGVGGPERTRAIDGAGLELASRAAQRAGVSRFILVSAFPDAVRAGPVPERFLHYLEVKKHADAFLAEGDLDWVILRPGRLTDDAGTGRARAAAALPYGTVPRDDVAAALVELVERPEVSRAVVELTSGETPVSEAIGRLAPRGR